MPTQPSDAPSSFTDVVTRIFKRATIDRDFRSAILVDPQVAFDAFDFQTDRPVRFVEHDTDADAELQLPPLVSNAESLSTEDLESVAGGSAQLDDCSNTHTQCELNTN